MAIVTTATLPQQPVIGVVTASVNCLRKHSFEFDQAILEELNAALLQQAQAKGAGAVIGVSYQLLSPTIRGYVEFKMTAIGTAIAT